MNMTHFMILITLTKHTGSLLKLIPLACTITSNTTIKTLGTKSMSTATGTVTGTVTTNITMRKSRMLSNNAMDQKMKNQSILLRTKSRTSKPRTHSLKGTDMKVKIHNTRSQSNKTEKKEIHNLLRMINSLEAMTTLERIPSKSNQSRREETGVIAENRDKISKGLNRTRKLYIQERSSQKILWSSGISPSNLSKNKWKDT